MTKPQPSVTDTVKAFLADPKERIRLDDFVAGLLRTALAALSSDNFSTSEPPVTANSFQARLTAYEDTIKDLLCVVILIARWGQGDQMFLLKRIFARLAEIKSAGGFAEWQHARWFPLSVLSYAAGVAALSVDNFSVLRPVLLAPIASDDGEGTRISIFNRASDRVTELADAFRALPDHTQHRVPFSEYMYVRIHAPLEELLFLGESYDRLFDDFEMISTLAYADSKATNGGRVWARPGRFAWKFMSRGEPFDGFVAEVAAQGDDWPPLRNGFFGSSTTRFQEVAKAYRVFLTNLHWH